LNVFGGRELDIVQQCKERYLSKEADEKTREFIRELLDIPIKVKRKLDGISADLD
jgi:hypothetical protein